jgi:hypothetical protein
MDNMKCLKNTKTGNIIRVTDIQAYQMEGRQWKYTSKTEWKEQERGTTITDEKTTENEQNRSK